MSMRLGVGLCVVLLAAQGCLGALKSYYEEPKLPASGFTAFPDKCADRCRDLDSFQPLLAPKPDLNAKPDIVNAWGVVLLNQIKDNFADMTPPGIGRALGMFSTCLYDAMTVFRLDWEPVYFKDRRPLGGDLQVLREVISGAGYAALEDMFGDFGSFSKVREFFDEVSPAGMTQHALRGQEACVAVLSAYKSDGFDGLGRSSSDPTNYMAVNKPQVVPGITNCAEEIINLDKWQPLCVPVEFKSQECNVQEWLAPYAGLFTTFGDIDTNNVVQTAGRPLYNGGSKEEYLRQAREVLEFSANLDDARKIIAEYWADGPDSTAPPGHWFEIALLAAEDEFLSPFDTVRLLLVVGNAVNDAGAASWAMKRAEDSIRPLQMIQCGLSSQQEEGTAWMGPYQGIGEVSLAEWQPYQAATFVTPAFAGWVSGHSTFSAAAAEALKLFFDDDTYVGPHCKLTEEGKSAFEPKRGPGDEFFEAGVTDVPNQGPKSKGYVPAKDVVICWDTFSEAAEQAGISRLHGGIHIIADHIDGKAIGREVGRKVFQKAQSLWG